MHLIQSALSQGMSGAHGKNFPVMFRQFFTSVGTFEVKNISQFERNFNNMLEYSTSIGV